MSMTVLPSGDAESVPGFLLRGPLRQVEPVQMETGRFSMLRSSLVLSGGIGGAIGALAFGGYLMIAEGKQEPSASEVHAVVAQPVVSEAPVLAKPDVTPAVEAEAPASEQSPAAQTETVPEGGPEAPHQVTTTRFDADPSVWTDVRKFSPLPADAAPVLDNPQPEPAPSATPSEGRRQHARAEVRHAHARHAGRRARLSKAAQERSRRAPVRAADNTSSDVGGTTMTAAQLRRDGSANPVVNAFAGMFGPK